MFKNKIVITLVISLSFLGFVNLKPANAAVGGAYQLLDNDNRAINSSQNPYQGPWNYGKYSGDYNGDHRLLTTGSNGKYQWNFTKQNSSSRIYYIYLKHPSFTDPGANYYVTTSYDMKAVRYLDAVGGINQHTAYPGWNKIGSQKAYSSDTFALVLYNGHYADGVHGTTGADAAEVDFY